VLEALRQIRKVGWVEGIPFFFGLKRVRVLFMSVNDVTNFCHVLDAFIQLMAKEDSVELVEAFLRALSQEPYKLYAVLIYQYFARDKISKEAAMLMSSLTRESVVFLDAELDEIFEKFDPDDLFPAQFRLMFQGVCEKKMEMHTGKMMTVTDAMMQLQFDLRDLSAKPVLQQRDVGALLDAVGELGPFAFKSFQAVDTSQEIL
jgi:hypothetical protein